jgi:PAS domain S-box-containing protein
MKSIRKLNEDLERRVEERTLELRKLSQATENSPASVVVTDKNGTIEYVNPTFCDVTGYSVKEAIGQNPRFLQSGTHPASFYKDLWDTILSGETWRGEFLNRKKSEEEFWESTSISAIKNDEGDITHFVAVKQDITDWKQAQQAIVESRAKYRDLVENANSIIFQMDIRGRITFLNRFAQDFFGYSEAEILGRHVVGTIVPATESTGRNLEIMIQDLVKHPERYVDNENENIRRNGELAWVVWTNRAIYDDENRLSEILCIGNDRTEQKRAEEALRESRATARGLLDATQESLLLLDSEGIVIAGNHTAAHRLQKSTEELIGINLFDLLPESTLASRKAHFNSVLQTGKPVEFEDTREGIIFHNSYFPVKAKTGEATGVAIFAQDITERKRAEEAVAKSEKEYRTLFENASIGIVVGQDQMFRFVNPQMEKLLAYKQSELTSRSIIDFFHPDDRNIIQERHEKRLKGESVPDVYNTRMVDRYGSTKWVEVKAVPIQWDDRPAALGFITDITERKRAEEELNRNVEELERFNKLAIGRELKMIQLKEEINEMLGQLDQDKKYKIVT